VFHLFRDKRHGMASLLGLLLAQAGVMRTAVAQEGNTWNSEEAGDQTEEAAPSEGDVTETIGTGESTPAVEAPEAAPEPSSEAPSANRTQVTGYVRQSFEFVYGEFAREALGPSSPEARDPALPLLWRDVFVSRSQLVLRASYQHGRSFEATISGVLGYTLHVAKAAPEYSVNVVELTRGEIEPELREAYLGFFWPSVDLRIGQQRVAWGRADFQSPNDVINARDLRDPFLAETELRYLPTLVARSSVNAGPVTFEVVVSPFFVPDRFDMYGSNWSAIQYHAREEYQRYLGSASALVDPSIERDLARLWRQTELPPNNGKGLAAGARLAASLSGADLSAYYHYGYDSTPYVTLDPAFQDYLASADLSRESSTSTKFKPIFDLIDQGIQPLRSRYRRRHHVGVDLATAFGPIVARLDAAYETQRGFYKLDLNSYAAPTVLGVFGLEYQTGSLDDVVLVELLGARLLRVPTDLPLLAYEQTTTAVAGTLRWTLAESWGIDLRGLVGIHPETYVVQPALRYKPSDALSLKLGALIMSGEQDSFGWYYGDNDTAFVQLRYAF
jgi:hypothetical protein